MFLHATDGTEDAVTDVRKNSVADGCDQKSKTHVTIEYTHLRRQDSGDDPTRARNSPNRERGQGPRTLAITASQRSVCGASDHCHCTETPLSARSRHEHQADGSVEIRENPHSVQFSSTQHAEQEAARFFSPDETAPSIGDMNKAIGHEDSRSLSEPNTRERLKAVRSEGECQRHKGDKFQRNE